FYDDKGDYERALEYYLMALDIWKKVLGEEHLDTATAYNNISLVYQAKGDYEQALEYQLRALDIQNKSFGETHPDMATYYNNIGFVYAAKGDYDRALEYQLKALDIRKNLFGEEHPDMAISYSSIGKLYYDQGDYAEATSYCRKSWKAIRNSSRYRESLDILAAQFFSGISDTGFLRDTLSLAMDTVEKARLDMSSMKDSLLKEALPVYYFGVDFAAKDKKPKKAFEYSEALRSRGFLDQMGTEAALRLDGVTDGDRQRVQELVSRISAARAELERQGSMTKQERDEARYKKAGDNLASAEKELARLDGEIGSRVPAYTQLRNPTPVSVSQAQDWCGKRRAVLEYVLWSPDIAGNTDTKNADIGSYCIVLTQKGVKTVRLDGDYDYAAAVNKLRNKVSGRKQEYQFEQERNELYKHLVAPVLSKLSGIEELVIVPDGCLSFLPFDILRKKEGAKCLGDQYAISFSPSVSVSVIADTHKERTESVLAFGGAWYDKTLSEAEHRRTLRGEGTRGAAKGADRGSLSTDFALTADNEAQLAYMRSHIREYGPGDYFAKLTWQDLPGTVAELDTLKNFVFTSGSYDERMQKSASEAELKKLSSSGKLKDYAVLHLACHGYFDRNIADMSSVLFSEVSGKLSGSSQDDGYLTIPETAVLSLDADMVCLSACETGLGEVKRGDGMVGLSRAFMVAGADRVGVSLWCIDDEATAEFMTLMYQKVRQEGKSYSRAYREVKAEFRRS
ncbi:MAG: CHAT domain-containing protein, partial [Treponema sp.]|nr:CHAT domain-containing protein [Treponema sp.]